MKLLGYWISASFLIFTCISLSFAELQQTQQKGSDHNNHATSDKRGTEDIPLVIKVLPSKEAQGSAEDDRKEKAAKRKTDEDLATYTGELATYTKILVGVGFVQAAIFVAQCVIFSRQERTAKTIERAYVFAKVERRNPIVGNNEGTALSQPIAMFINHGKTPAIIINMTGEPYVMATAPQEFVQTPDDDRRLPEGWVIAGGEKWFDRPINTYLTNNQIASIIAGTTKLYCAGMIRYKDILGYERRTGYCWEYLPRHDQFQFCKESRLNEYT